jgi:polyhydroxyalkanoate synthesis repressor PhaR
MTWQNDSPRNAAPAHDRIDVAQHPPQDTPMATPRIIKKYPNRRLYDTETSTYITLVEIKDLVLQYKDFQVLDAKTGDDLTRSILLQIILEEESGGVPMFSSDMLANIIRYYGHAMQGLMGSYLERSIHAFHEAQKRFQEQASTLYGEVPKVPAEAWSQLVTGAPQIPNVMGGYLEKGAQAVIDMQDELRRQALKLFSGFPYANAADAPAAAPAKPAAKAKAPRKARPKKK